MLKYAQCLINVRNVDHDKDAIGAEEHTSPILQKHGLMVVTTAAFLRRVNKFLIIQVFLTNNLFYLQKLRTCSYAWFRTSFDFATG
jgi:hypothetical protein